MHRRARQDELALNFLGAGAYEHHIPAAVWELATRGEYYKRLHALSGRGQPGYFAGDLRVPDHDGQPHRLEVSNASLYDGASALAEAVLMAVRVNTRSDARRVLVPRTLHPHYRAVVRTITSNQGIELVELPYDPASGRTDLDALDGHAGGDITAVAIPQPNIFGVLEDVDAMTDWAADNGALAIGVVNPMALGLLSPPGEWGRQGAPIACGEGQPLGVPLSSGGPYFGFLTCRQALVRQLPGRLVGRTVDMDGKPGFTLTLQAREQHIRRSRATSNICTNQGLMVTAATVFMSLLGPVGHPPGRLGVPRPHRGAGGGRADRLRGVGGIPVAPIPRGGAALARSGRPRARADARRRPPRRRQPGAVVPRVGPRAAGVRHRDQDRGGRSNLGRVAARRHRRSGGRVVTEPLIFERGRPGRMAGLRYPGRTFRSACPSACCGKRSRCCRRSRNWTSCVTTPVCPSRIFPSTPSFYPLGSCTMKYNPRGCNSLAALPGFLQRHPLAHEDVSQGFLACLFELQQMLCRVTGMRAFSLTPMAGAQGELSGVAMIRAYHLDRGDGERTEILVPDAAHGTNPATATMCGCTVRELPTAADGDMDIGALRALVGPRTAGVMLTNPSTLGVFERRIGEVREIVHGAGGLLYYDGANLNAILGKVLPGDMGFDVIHVNLHKTFSTPHGGGGPGSGRWAWATDWSRSCPCPSSAGAKTGTTGWTARTARRSIGRLSAFMGNAGVLLRAYIYMRMLGREGMERVADYAVLNANYLMVKLAEAGFDLSVSRSAGGP